MQDQAKVLPFPVERATTVPVPEEARGPDGLPRRNYVRIEPVVGNNGIELTYIDNNWVPRMKFIADITVSQESVECMRRFMQRAGESLRPLSGSAGGATPLWPRVLP